MLGKTQRKYGYGKNRVDGSEQYQRELMDDLGKLLQEEPIPDRPPPPEDSGGPAGGGKKPTSP